MRVVGLFAGIGGFEVGLHKAGHEPAMFCEIDKAAQAVLSYQFPRVDIVSDVRKLARLPKGIDLVTAGFPCQDLSPVGATEGIGGSRSGLIDEVFRIVRRSRPAWVLLENVPFLLKLQRGRGIALIVSELEKLGYSWAYRVIDARAFGLPQRRQRVFILASRGADPTPILFRGNREEVRPIISRSSACGFYWTEGNRGLGWAVDGVPTLKGGSSVGIPSPPAIWFPDGRIATPDIRDAERLQGFRANWTRPAELVAKANYRWTLIGNAVSVPVAYWIGVGLAKQKHPRPLCGLTPLAGAHIWPTAACGTAAGRRFAASVSTWPVLRDQKRIADFLQFETKPLSPRAAIGFRSRLKNSRLSREVRFEAALDRYVPQLSATDL